MQGRGEGGVGGGWGVWAGKEGEGKGEGLAGPSAGWMRVLAGVGEAVVGRAKRRIVIVRIRVTVVVSVREKVARLIEEPWGGRVVGGLMAILGARSFLLRGWRKREGVKERKEMVGYAGTAVCTTYCAI